MRRTLRWLLLAAALAAVGLAQTTAARIMGTVQDNTGAVVPNVRISTTNTETGARRSVSSNHQGQYVVYPLPPGVYDVVAEADGFQTERLEHLRLDVADTVLRNILIGPGLNVADVNLAKSFPVWREGRRITLRLEAFNVFNHPNFDFPDANISNTNTVGSINRVLRPMRQAQFAVRFDF